MKCLVLLAGIATVKELVELCKTEDVFIKLYIEVARKRNLLGERDGTDVHVDLEGGDVFNVDPPRS